MSVLEATDACSSVGNAGKLHRALRDRNARGKFSARNCLR